MITEVLEGFDCTVRDVNSVLHFATQPCLVAAVKGFNVEVFRTKHAFVSAPTIIAYEEEQQSISLISCFSESVDGGLPQTI